MAKPGLAAPAEAAIREGPSARRPVFFAGGRIETPVFDRAALAAGASIAGPAVIEEMSATTLLHPGQRAIVDGSGNLIVTV